MLPQENRTRTIILFILTGIGLYTLLPFLLLTQYIHPAADDFSFAVRDKQLDYLTVLQQYYMNWAGRYFSTITLFRINPMIYDALVTYKVYALALLLLLATTVYAIVKTIVRGALTKKHVLALAAMLLVSYFLQLPSPSEGFYFFATYATYQLPNILLFALLILLYRFFKVQGSGSKKLYIGVAAIVCTAIIGSNEMALVITFTTVLFVTIVNFKQKPYRPYLLFLLIVCVACCLVAVLAPGNFNRMHEHPNGGRLVWSVVFTWLLKRRVKLA